MPEDTFVSPSCSLLLHKVLSYPVYQSECEVLKHSTESQCHCLISVIEMLQVVISVEKPEGKGKKKKMPGKMFCKWLKCFRNGFFTAFSKLFFCRRHE